MNRWWLVLAAGVLGATCARAGGGANPVAVDRVELPPSYLFRPAAITVGAGTGVTWVNHDHFTHSVRLLDDSGTIRVLRPGDSVTVLFAAPGVHHYDCSFHPRDMHGTVTVTPKP
ncbi:MAG TPA: plastocyanin/azurin family copper-binding protein [Gemmatimonadales bacterium]|nr:plastocyanin/azurin family copper-binding protein [Gemmatimonadales bacterium]